MDRRGLVERVVDELKGLVTAGTWVVGERIPAEGQLAAQLGVGRSTVREAVRALAHVGILEVRQGDGTRVRANDELTVLLNRRMGGVEQGHILEVRAALEAEAARLAAERRTASDVEALGRALVARERAWATGELGPWVDADLDLHVGVVDAAHNPFLSRVYRGFLDELRASIEASVADGLTGTTHIDHSALVAAIRAGDSAAAVECVRAVIHEVHAATDPTTAAV